MGVVVGGVAPTSPARWGKKKDKGTVGVSVGRFHRFPPPEWTAWSSSGVSQSKKEDDRGEKGVAVASLACISRSQRSATRMHPNAAMRTSPW